MKKYILSIALAIVAFAAVSVPVHAAPTPANKNTVLFGFDHNWILPIPHAEREEGGDWYETGTGWDLILIRGKSKQIHQWFIGDGYGIKSTWNISKNGKCRGKTVDLIENPSTWGLWWAEEGADYCVRSNRFTVQKFPISWERYIFANWHEYGTQWEAWEAYLAENAE